MEENKDYDVQTTDKTVEKRHFTFPRDFLFGVCIGAAFIIPGFSGGSVAAILGIYERLIDSITNLFNDTKKSIMTLLPVSLGLISGAVALLYPIGYFLSRYPLSTVSLFVGLTIGAIPSLLEKVKGRADRGELSLFFLALAASFAICFLPIGSGVDLFSLNFFGYVLLFLVGAVGACALVIPGISGSMILLMLGYYDPIVRMITNDFMRLQNVGHSILVLGILGVGIIVGFFLISFVMKRLLSYRPRATYFAIIGFIIGSLPNVYLSTMRSQGMLTPIYGLVGMPPYPVFYVICLFLILLGAFASYNLSGLKRKMNPFME